MPNQWIPEKQNADAVHLPEELQELTELLAEEVHNTWALGRIREGWTYGPERSDSTKLTPCLVPYAQLPESEKEYDRNTAKETLRSIIRLGFTIRKQDE